MDEEIRISATNSDATLIELVVRALQGRAHSQWHFKTRKD
jgi:hypothetical protein